MTQHSQQNTKWPESVRRLPAGALLRPLDRKGSLPAGAMLRPVPRGTKQPEIGKMEHKTGRLVLHAPRTPEKIQKTATAEHDDVRKALETALAGVPGARLAGDRDEKDPDRVAEKIDDGQSPRTVRDYSGFRVSVETPEDWKRAAAALRAHFEVPDEQDLFEKGSEENFHGHTLQIRMPGSQVTHEVQILPREVSENADGDHKLYEKARSGDIAAAQTLKGVNQSHWDDFAGRNGLTNAANSEKRSPLTPPRPPKHRSATKAGPDKPGSTVGIKRGDPVVLDDGRRAVAAYVPDSSKLSDRPLLPAYRFRPEDGSRLVEMRGPKVEAGGAVVAPAEPDGRWIGVDLDGTLAQYDGWKGVTHVGAPIPEMVERVKGWLAQGKDVRLLTARIGDDPTGAGRKAIVAWTEKNLGRRLALTDVKDAKMTHLYDDRAVTVEKNTGKLLAEPQPE